jgi:hypothetical protein
VFSNRARPSPAGFSFHAEEQESASGCRKATCEERRQTVFAAEEQDQQTGEVP